MSELSNLPNIGAVLESNLIKSGITTPEQLRDIGSEEAFIRIRSKADPDACIRMLYGIQGAIEGMPDTMLAEDTKIKLKEFYKKLS